MTGGFVVALDFDLEDFADLADLADFTDFTELVSLLFLDLFLLCVGSGIFRVSFGISGSCCCFSSFCSFFSST